MLPYRLSGIHRFAGKVNTPCGLGLLFSMTAGEVEGMDKLMSLPTA